MHTSNCYMNLVSKVPEHQNFRTHDWVVVLFVKRYGFCYAGNLLEDG